MHEHLLQPDLDATEVSTSKNLHDQNSAPLADSGYEETSIPYMPSPSAKPPQTSSRRAAPSQEDDTKPAMQDGRTLAGAIVGAILGAVLSFVMKGNVWLWTAIGAVVGAFAFSLLSALFTDRDGGGTFWEALSYLDWFW